MRPSLLSLARVSVLILIAAGLGACREMPDTAAPPSEAGFVASQPETEAARPAEPETSKTETFRATGVLQSVTPSGSHAVIAHDRILGFMDAMTMPFALSDSVRAVARPLPAGTQVVFSIEVGQQGPVVRSLRPASEAGPKAP